MEEQRIGHMYLNLFKRRVGALWDSLFRRQLRRSRALPALLLLVLIGLPGLGYYLHRLGQFSTLKRQIKGEPQGAPESTAQPGGADPIVLMRAQTSGGDQPEFRSATMLPGLGMGVLQITAMLPGRGEVPLLASPTVEQLASGMTHPREGSNDTHGAIELPWGGVLTGVLTPLATTLRTTWRGSTLEAPLDRPGQGIASGGLLAMLPANTAQTMPQPSGPVAVATFHAGDFNQHWVSRTDVSVRVSLGARLLELTVTAKNVGEQPEPLGIGWHPRFVIPSGDRTGAELRLPGGDELLVDTRGLPSGKSSPAAVVRERLPEPVTKLGAQGLDRTFTHLRPTLLESAAGVELRDPASGFALRLSASASSVRALRVNSPAGAKYVSLGLQTNFDDPLGREWRGSDEPAISTLPPGQSQVWTLRLEILPLERH